MHQLHAGSSGRFAGYSDEQLVAAVNAGDAGAFAAIYERHKAYVFRVARRYCATDSQALDAMQDTFAWFLTRFPGFELTAKLTTFLFPVARNCGRSVRQRDGRASGVGDCSPDVADAERGPADADSPAERVRRVVERLPEKQRDVLLLRFIDDESLAQIALMLNIPVGTVKSRLFLGLKVLREDPQTRRLFGLDPDDPEGGEARCP